MGRIGFKLTDLCPCGSGKTLKDCCKISNGKLKAKPCKLRIQGPKTKYSNPKCYLSSLNDCSTQITGEHYFSHAVLKVLNVKDELKATGLPWLEDGVTSRVQPQTLKSKILCSRHNSGLSPLDHIALRFFTAFVTISNEFRDEKLKELQRVFLFNGHDIERWMLKTLCGCIAANIAETKLGRMKNWKPVPLWIKILLGQRGFPTRCGMYLSVLEGQTMRRDRSLAFAPLSNPNFGVYGGKFGLNGYDFILTLETPPIRKDETIFENHTFRPIEIRMEKDGSSKLLLLSWDVQGENKAIKSLFV